jgi:type II secretory pathway pseudopilin PulG
MKKQKAFSLFETIISILILSMVFGAILNFHPQIKKDNCEEKFLNQFK